MNRAMPTRYLFLLFALVVGISSMSLIYDPDNEPEPIGRPCEQDKCYAEINSDDPRYACEIKGHNQRVIYPIEGTWEDYEMNIPSACWRSNIFDGDRYVVAYPSIGGVVLLKDPSAVDLQYLGLPNTHDTRRSPEEDNDLATRMVQFGAQWWPTWDLYFRHYSLLSWEGVFYDYHYPSDVHMAFPSTGGVWVANFTSDGARRYYEDVACERWLPTQPWDWRYRTRYYTLTMDDKAEILKDIGATFYSSVDEVPGLAKTVDEAVGLFEPFKERLKSMESYEYRQRFCNYRDMDKNTTNEKPEESEVGTERASDELR